VDRIKNGIQQKYLQKQGLTMEISYVQASAAIRARRSMNSLPSQILER